jgi:hypothetical protein
MMAKDIWFELGNEERFRSSEFHSEVNEALSRSKERTFSRKGKDEKWRIVLKKKDFRKNLEGRDGRKKQFSLPEVR